MAPLRPRSEALALLGLARRAGALVKGAEAVREALKGGRRVYLVILAEDAAPARRKRIEALAGGRAVPCLRLARMEELGEAVGSAPVAAIGVTKEGLAKNVMRRIAGQRHD